MLAGCASPSEPGPAPSGGPTGFESVEPGLRDLDARARIDRLRAIARREDGALSLYTSLSPEPAAAVEKAFEAEFGVEVDLYRASSETVAQRALEEARADFRGPDVVETNGPEMVVLARQGVLAPYRPAGVDAAIDGVTHPGWTATRLNKFTVGWNTDRAPPGGAPRSWEDLAHPRWRGRLAMEASDVDWFKTLHEHLVASGRTVEQVDALFRGMAENAVIVKGHSLMDELLQAGDSAVVASDFQHLLRAGVAKGAPVDFRPAVEPVVVRPNGAGLVRGARHPATAVLFVEWLLADGQEVLARFEYDPVRRDLARPPATREVTVDVERFVDQRERWARRYEALIERGRAGPEED